MATGQISHNRIPLLIHQLRLLVEKDIRPLDIRFVEAIRFIAGNLAAGQRLLLCFTPRTSLQDKVLVEFFQALLRVLPVQVKMLIGQGNEDVLAGQVDFCPSNRLILAAEEEKDRKDIQERYRACLESGLIAGRLLHILANLIHPVGLDLLTKITGDSEEALDRVLSATEMEDLVETVFQQHVPAQIPRRRLLLKVTAAYNGTTRTVWSDSPWTITGRRLIRERADYMDVLAPLAVPAPYRRP